MSTGCKSSHNGFLDVSRSNGGLRISGWIGQLLCLAILSCLAIFSTSLSVAAFLCRAGVQAELTTFNMNERRDSNVESSFVVDGKSVRPTSDCRQLHFEPGSA